MNRKESLITIAYEAGFKDLHDRTEGSNNLENPVISGTFKIFYYKHNNGPLDRTIDIFCVVNQYDYDTATLFRFERKELERNSGNGGINIDKVRPLFVGKTAIDILRSYANNSK